MTISLHSNIVVEARIVHLTLRNHEDEESPGTFLPNADENHGCDQTRGVQLPLLVARCCFSPLLHSPPALI